MQHGRAGMLCYSAAHATLARTTACDMQQGLPHHAGRLACPAGLPSS